MPKRPAAFIPQRPDEITTEWLTEKLGQPASVLSFTTSSPGTGVGFSGITTKLTLEWDSDDPSLPREVVAKFPTDLPHRGLNEQEGMYEREIWFYEGMGLDMPGRIPVCLHAEMDPGPSETSRRRVSRAMNRTPTPLAKFVTKRANKLIRPSKRRYVLLIEYVDGARLTPLDQEIPDDDLAAIMRSLATMHARYWGDRRLGNDRSTSYDTASQQHKFLQVGYDLWVDDFFARTPGLEDRHRRVTDWAQHNLPAVLRRLNEPLTLIHGDARSDNMLFLADGTLVMIDFSTVSAAPPGWDVGYSLSAGIEPGDDARPKLHRMAEIYHEALIDAGVDDHPLDELLADIDATLCFLAHRQVLTAALVEGGYPDDGDAGTTTSLGDLWMRKIIDLLPEAPPTLGATSR